ncbi:MAG: tRNA preQ1(34) S-adenosylmethionine ribosyltransferase-isomerase QueA [Sumerlaeia bacterium]
MLTSDYDYDLPEELIAPHPAPERDASRLMVVPREGEGLDGVAHRVFRDIEGYLRPGDLLVMNDSRVMPARIFGQRLPGRGACEALLLEPLPPGEGGGARWLAMMRPGRKLKPGTEIEFAPGFTATVQDIAPGGERVLAFAPEVDVQAQLEAIGHMPLPPYILARRADHADVPEDRERYQTVYAKDVGSVAAPTAGLHFTEALLGRLAAKGVEQARVTLHVGAGTFQGIATDSVEDHAMHSEHYHVGEETAAAVNRAKAEGRRVIAVGTTSVRTLESAVGEDGLLRAERRATKLMIVPGYRFRIVDGLITNFHLPRSTLLCLVSALIGRERLLALYEEAIRERYRFYSYGDAMAILPDR